jgi:hypothetical protein
MPWHRPSALVENLEHLVDRVRLHCRVQEVPTEPVAPASLWSHPTQGYSAYDLHHVHSRSESSYVFETFDIETRNPTKIGETLYLQSHWLPEAMRAALDQKAIWHLRVYPGEVEDHHHCLFTWETISSYSGAKEGYWAVQYGWITTQAYEDFIVNDIYHIRASDA